MYAIQVTKVSKTLPGTLTRFYIRYSQVTDNVWHFSPHSIVIKSNCSATLNVSLLLSYVYIPGLSHLQGICPISTAGLKFTVPFLAELTWQRFGVGVKVKLGTDKKLCCILPFSPLLIPLS